MNILAAYLPEQLSEEEVHALAHETTGRRTHLATDMTTSCPCSCPRSRAAPTEDRRRPRQRGAGPRRLRLRRPRGPLPVHRASRRPAHPPYQRRAPSRRPRAPPATSSWRRLAWPLAAAGAPPEATLSLTLSNDAELAELNAEHMGKDGPTDVLSFPLLPPTAFPAHTARTRPSAAAGRARLRPAARQRRPPRATSSSRSSAPSRRPMRGAAARRATYAGPRPTSCACSSRTGPCTSAAGTTPSRLRRPRCVRSSATSWGLSRGPDRSPDRDPFTRPRAVTSRSAHRTGGCVTVSRRALTAPPAGERWRGRAPHHRSSGASVAAHEGLEDALDVLGRDTRSLVPHDRGGGPGAAGPAARSSPPRHPAASG